MEDIYKMSQEAADELKEKLKRLRTEGRADVAEKIKEAKSFGDLSENSEYDEAKSEQGKLEAEIKELEYQLEHLEIIDEKVLDKNKVHTGSVVEIEDRTNGYTDVYTIVGAPQASPLEGLISDESPVGKGLLGHEAGEEVWIETPGGNVNYLIKSIRFKD